MPRHTGARRRMLNKDKDRDRDKDKDRDKGRDKLRLVGAAAYSQTLAECPKGGSGMTAEETGKLFVLLETLFPAAAKKAGDKKARLAWGYVLEPYGYDEVRRAVVEYARGHRYFPDVYDITGALPAPPPPDETRKPWSAGEIAAFQAQYRRDRALLAQWKREEKG